MHPLNTDNPKKVYIRTFGCQMNVSDSEFFANVLTRCFDCELTDDIAAADIAIFNTCTVRQHAEDRALSIIGKLKKWKEKDNSRILIVCGCAVERLKKDTLKARFPFIDVLVSSREVLQFGEIVSKYLPVRQKQDSDKFIKSYPIIRNLGSKERVQVSAFVPIMRGCNNFCSYCIVPYVRGEEYSIPPQEILEEINCLVANGIREVTLVGQNVNSYKWEQKNNNSGAGIVDFADLLEEVNKISGLRRIRFLTNHPKDMNDKIISAVGDLEKVCKHIHLPLQSGSSRILNLMNRKYTKEDYLSLVEKIYSKIPNVSITTDIIVGFPTETEKDFKETLEVVSQVRFDNAFCFKYSVREMTAAAKNFIDDVPQETKEARLAELLDLVNEISYKKNVARVGKIEEVLVEKIDTADDATTVELTGRIDNNITTKVRVNKDCKDTYQAGDMIKVKITSAAPHTLFAEPLEKK
jgi:tRNA-2-methylthio-N6-dimethylallyladenosine synthase